MQLNQLLVMIQNVSELLETYAGLIPRFSNISVQIVAVIARLSVCR